MDLSAGARSLVETSLGVKEGEVVMVLVDASNIAIGHAFVEACGKAKADGFLVVLDPVGTGLEPPGPITAAMKESDAVVMATSHSLTHTLARRQANRAGTRVASIPGITEAMMAEGCLVADHREVEERISRVHKSLRKARELRITTARGSNLTLRIEGRPWITGDTGLCTSRGSFATFPAGELLVAPLEGTAEGSLTVDVLFHQFLTAPASVTVREGYAVRVEGATEAEAAMDAGGHDGRHLSRLGIGLNPTASLTSTPLEAFKALGCLHLGFGDNRVLGGEVTCDVEVDAVLKGISVEADGERVLDRGRLA